MRPTCPKCRAPLGRDALIADGACRCPGCKTEIWISLYPALLRRLPDGGAADASALPDESSCFYHPGRRAIVVCGQCGRFLCSLCDIELGEQRLCPGCIKSGRRKGTLAHLDRQRMRHDRLILALAVYPMLLFYFTIITAPVVLMLTFWFWNAPRSVVEPSSKRFIIAAILALFQIIGWIGLISYFIQRPVDA